MKGLIEQARSLIRLAQAFSDAFAVVEKALLRERPSNPKVVQVGKITDGHLLFHQYNGHWPTDRRELDEFMEDMGFEE